MPMFLVVTLLVASLLGPLALSVVTIVFSRPPVSWAIMSLLWLVGLSAHVGLGVYGQQTYGMYPSVAVTAWWYLVAAAVLCYGMLCILNIENDFEHSRMLVEHDVLYDRGKLQRVS